MQVGRGGAAHRGIYMSYISIYICICIRRGTCSATVPAVV